MHVKQSFDLIRTRCGFNGYCDIYPTMISDILALWYISDCCNRLDSWSKNIMTINEPKI